jgi:hypothetical protein
MTIKSCFKRLGVARSKWRLKHARPQGWPPRWPGIPTFHLHICPLPNDATNTSSIPKKQPPEKIPTAEIDDL